MTILEFVAKAKKQDTRNIFTVYDGDVSYIPKELVEFYKQACPIDVEVRTRRYGNIYFSPISQLKDLHSQYSFFPHTAFIFATTNSDPIFVENGMFYLSYKSGYEPEKIADNLSDFFDSLKII